MPGCEPVQTPRLCLTQRSAARCQQHIDESSSACTGSCQQKVAGIWSADECGTGRLRLTASVRSSGLQEITQADVRPLVRPTASM